MDRRSVTPHMVSSLPPRAAVWRTTLVLWLVAALAAFAAAPARAEGETFTDQVPLSLTVTGPNSSSSTSIPVLPGLTPVSLTATIVGGTGPTSYEGSYTLRSGTAFASVSAQTGGPVTLNLSPDIAKDGVIPLTLTSEILRPDGCPDDTEAIASVDSAVVTYSGIAATPTSLADFLNPAVTSIWLRSSDDAVAFTAPAMLQAASALGYAYPRAAISTSDPGQTGPRARIIDFVPGAGDVVAVVDSTGDVPTLVLTGDPAALVPAAIALQSPEIELAAGTDTTQDLAQAGQAPDNLTLTWADIGSSTPALTGLGTQSATIFVAQSRFGQPVEKLDVTINGTNIPTPEGATAYVSLFIDDQLYASSQLSNSDRFSLTATVTPERIKRTTKITVQMVASPAGGLCTSPSFPARVDLDAVTSTISATPGQSLDPGFDRFPQTLRHSFPVAFAKGITPADVGNAVTVVASVSRQETSPLLISVPSASEFFDSKLSGLLVNAGPEESARLDAPLVFGATRAPVTVPPLFTVTTDTPYAAFEAFDQNGRDVLMLGSFNGGDSAVGQALQSVITDFLAPAPDGWFETSGGDLLVATETSGPTLLDLTQVPPPPASAATPGSPWWVWLLAVLGIAVLVGLGWTMVRRESTTKQ